MELPLCFSQYFVNKQNIRSYSNIVKSKHLKTEDEFLKFALGSKELVSASALNPYRSSKLQFSISKLLKNLKTKIDDFKSYFSQNNKFDLLPVDKETIFHGCMKALLEIVPRELLGNNHNLKLLKKAVFSIIFSMKGEHVMINHLFGKWDFRTSLWPHGIDADRSYENIAQKIQLHFLCWIFKDILAPMICLNFYVTTCKLSSEERKLYYFKRCAWQRFFDCKMHHMISKNIIEKCTECSLGSNIRKKYSLSERLKIKTMWKQIPKLYLVLKSNDEFRPIVRYKNPVLTPVEKFKAKEKQHFLQIMLSKPRSKFEVIFSNLQNAWNALKRPKLYFIKADLKNAFGSINIVTLTKILCEHHKELQKQEQNVSMKRKWAQKYRELIAELRQPLLVKVGSTVYQWNEGLVQGYKYSPALSEIYYNYHDKLYLSKILEKSNSCLHLFTRVVDDYLYITDSLDKAIEFLEGISKYENLNYDKTVVNFAYPNLKCSNEIVFLGYSYNTTTMQVTRAENAYSGQICYKIAFTLAITNVPKFLENRIGQSGITINGHIFNLHHNNETFIWHQIFLTYCISANKFCTILAIICGETEMCDYLEVYKKKVTVKLGNSMISTLIKNKPAPVEFYYCINHFRYLSFKALELCAKQTPRCNILVPKIQNYMAKSNCMSGKWQEHASRVNAKGTPQVPANRNVCRKYEFKSILKNIEVLPKGIECYNKKSRS